MRPISQQCFAALPVALAAVLVFVTASPIQGGVVSYTPNIALLFSLLLAGSARYYWPTGVAFALGLLQDVLFGTPLGAQALLALLLTQWVVWQQARGHSHVQFRLQWIEAIGTLVACHAALWLVIALAGRTPPPFVNLLIAGAINGIWYAPLYALLRRESASS